MARELFALKSMVLEFSQLCKHN